MSDQSVFSEYAMLKRQEADIKNQLAALKPSVFASLGDHLTRQVSGLGEFKVSFRKTYDFSDFSDIAIAKAELKLKEQTAIAKGAPCKKSKILSYKAV